MKTADIEFAAREWLRTLPVVGPHVYFGVPDTIPEGHFTTLGRVGGGPGTGTSPFDGARLSFSAWGRTKREAGDLARALVDIFTEVEEQNIGNGCKVRGASVDLMLWQPAADTGRPRYIVDVTVHTSTTNEGA